MHTIIAINYKTSMHKENIILLLKQMAGVNNLSGKSCNRFLHFNDLLCQAVQQVTAKARITEYLFYLESIKDLTYEPSHLV